MAQAARCEDLVLLDFNWMDVKCLTSDLREIDLIELLINTVM